MKHVHEEPVLSRHNRTDTMFSVTRDMSIFFVSQTFELTLQGVAGRRASSTTLFSHIGWVGPQRSHGETYFTSEKAQHPLFPAILIYIEIQGREYLSPCRDGGICNLHLNSRLSSLPHLRVPFCALVWSVRTGKPTSPISAPNYSQLCLQLTRFSLQIIFWLLVSKNSEPGL